MSSNSEIKNNFDDIKMKIQNLKNKKQDSQSEEIEINKEALNKFKRNKNDSDKVNNNDNQDRSDYLNKLQSLTKEMKTYSQQPNQKKNPDVQKTSDKQIFEEKTTLNQPSNNYINIINNHSNEKEKNFTSKLKYIDEKNQRKIEEKSGNEQNIKTESNSIKNKYSLFDEFSLPRKEVEKSKNYSNPLKINKDNSKESFFEKKHNESREGSKLKDKIEDLVKNFKIQGGSSANLSRKSETDYKYVPTVNIKLSSTQGSSNSKPKLDLLTNKLFSNSNTNLANKAETNNLSNLRMSDSFNSREKKVGNEGGYFGLSSKTPKSQTFSDYGEGTIKINEIRNLNNSLKLLSDEQIKKLGENCISELNSLANSINRTLQRKKIL